MDRLLREGNPPTGQLASPKPQYKKPGVDEYAPVEGQHGAPFAILKDASGAVVSPATEATLEQVRALLSGVATENKLEQARTLLDAISTKDFATSSKQDALNIAVEDLKSELILVKSELANIKANQLSGDQKVQLSGTIVKLATIDDVIITPGSTLRLLNSDVERDDYKEIIISFRFEVGPFKLAFGLTGQSDTGQYPYQIWENIETFDTQMHRGHGKFEVYSTIYRAFIRNDDSVDRKVLHAFVGGIR